MRVPTYATYLNMTNATIANKNLVDLYSFQSITGLKAQNYSGYGMSASSIVSLEATLGVTSTFMENNKITEVEIKTMNTSMEAIQKAINDFKSTLTSFSGITGNGGEGTTITDNTGGKLTFTSNDPDDYIGKSVIIDGTEYKFANNSNGNNIDISGATTAEEIMMALKDKLPANADYDFDGTTFTYPLGTVDNNSTIIKANGVTTGSPVTTTTGGSSLTPDYTGGELTFTNDNVADYLGQTITINGVQYTFANDGNGNNIDISGAANAEDVMNALKDKLPANADFKFEGNKFTFPLYTINGASSVLNVNGVETGEPYTMNSDQARELRQLQNSAFSALKMLVDSLNTFANGKYLFGGGVSNQPPVNFPFSTLDEFQAYYDGLNIQYPGNSSADLSNFSVNASNTGNISLKLNGNNTNQGTITAEKAGGFLKPAITANDKTTGTLTFNSDKNTMNATEYGAFNTLSAGDTVVIGGNGAGGNAKAYIVKSVSADGKTVTFEESTPVVTDDVITPNNDVTFSKSFPVGSVINMDGFKNNNIAGQVQVTGISDDGTELYVTVDPSRFPTTTIAASSSWSLSTESYYKGGDLTSEKRISENQSISFDVNANDPAFEKLFRALGTIAQGNFVDTRNPADDITGTISSENPIERVNEALDLISDALFNASENANVKNADIYTISAKINSNYVVLNQTTENQTAIKANLENNISSLKNVDKTEAATKLLLASQNLEASYAVLQQAMSLSLLDYIK